MERIDSTLDGIRRQPSFKYATTFDVFSSVSILLNIPQYKRFAYRYGFWWLYIGFYFPSIPSTVASLERLLNASDKQISEFRKGQEALLSNTGITAAIITQVTVTSLGLSNVDTSHWSIRAMFYTSLVFSLVAVYIAFIKHREFTTTSVSYTRNALRRKSPSLRVLSGSRKLFKRFFTTKGFDEPNELVDMVAVIALYLPYALLNAAICSYFLGLYLYLLWMWQGFPGHSQGEDIPTRNVFIFYVLALILGYLSLGLAKSSLRAGQEPETGETTGDIPMTTIPKSDDIDVGKALLEAAEAHRAAATASSNAAATFEKLAEALGSVDKPRPRYGAASGHAYTS